MPWQEEVAGEQELHKKARVDQEAEEARAKAAAAKKGKKKTKAGKKGQKGGAAKKDEL